MKQEISAVYCFKCNTMTEHIVRTDRSGEITKTMCRACKHTHVVGSSREVCEV